MLHLNLKTCPEAETFLAKFREDQRTKVVRYLIALGIDMAKKLGHNPGTPELYQTLQQLAKNIEKESKKHTDDSGLKGEIKKIQEQLKKLNEKFQKTTRTSQEDEEALFSAESWNKQKQQYQGFHQPNFARDDNAHNQDRSPIHQNNFFNNGRQYQQHYDQQQDHRQQRQHQNQHYQQQLHKHQQQPHKVHPQYNDRSPERWPNQQHQYSSPLQQHHNIQRHQNHHYQPFEQEQMIRSHQFHPTSSRQNRMQSPKGRDNQSQEVTAKITESPPPPIVYIQNVRVNVRRHLDDRQIKSLLYDQDDERTPKQSKQKGQKHQPKSIKYTIPANGHAGYSEAVFEPIQHQHNPRHQTDIAPVRQEDHHTPPQHHEPLHAHSRQSRSNKPHNPKTQQTTLTDSRTRKLPTYLQNVQSKIRDQIMQDKMQYYHHQHESDQYHQHESEQNENTAQFDNDRYKAYEQHYESDPDQRQPSYENRQESYQNRQWTYSPVQEMNAIQDSDHKVSDFPRDQMRNRLSEEPNNEYDQQNNDFDLQKVSSLREVASFKQEDHNDSDSGSAFSSFTPPNKEVREFFQRQFQQQS